MLLVLMLLLMLLRDLGRCGTTPQEVFASGDSLLWAGILDFSLRSRCLTLSEVVLIQSVEAPAVRASHNQQYRQCCIMTGSVHLASYICRWSQPFQPATVTNRSLPRPIDENKETRDIDIEQAYHVHQKASIDKRRRHLHTISWSHLNNYTSYRCRRK